MTRPPWWGSRNWRSRVDAKCPIYSQVILDGGLKEWGRNLDFRERLIRTASDKGGDRKVQSSLWTACSRDVLFWINAFVWTYDPRKPGPAQPFITYPAQDEAILDLCEAMEPGHAEDVHMDKSRDLGGSWVVLMAYVHQWHFVPRRTFLMVSRKEALVDSRDDPDSLYWKIDFILRYEPQWLRPLMSQNDRTSMHLRNPEMESTIDGDSTTGDVGVGGRRTSAFFDEFARVDEAQSVIDGTADVSRCRVWVSTPRGAAHPFAKLRNSVRKRITLHWSTHPEKAVGMYRVAGGKVVEIIDKEWHQKNPGYKFVTEDIQPGCWVGAVGLRSPWYDSECKRRASRSDIAENLDINYRASGAQFFDEEVLNRILNEDCRPPTMVGEITYDDEECFPKMAAEDAKGRWRLWVPQSRPARDRNYAMGVDVSSGTGASNSCITIKDGKSMEKVASFASPFVTPEELANIAVAAGRWFGGQLGAATMCWEATGPGRIFGRRVMELSYGNVYWRKNESSVKQKATDTPGWFPTRDNKEAVLGEYRRCLAARKFINRDEASVREASEYVYGNNGVCHQAEQGSDDPSGAGSQHGDRVIADALANHACGEQAEEVPIEPETMYGTFYYRRETARRRQAETALW